MILDIKLENPLDSIKVRHEHKELLDKHEQVLVPRGKSVLFHSYQGKYMT